MSKYLLEDMVRVKRSKKENTRAIDLQQEKVVDINQKKNKPHYMLWFVAFISVLFCFFAFSFLFSKAEIIVNPKTMDVVLNENLSASKESNDDSLPFNLVVSDGSESKNIQVSGEKNVEVAATGIVVIYNSYSSSPQTLNIDTRLEGSNGKIYKTKTRIVVPGITKDGKSGFTEVGIYADKVGEEYNSAPIDFQILGFKGTPKYSKFIGRSKTGTQITGGFKGKTATVSDAEKAAVIGELKNTLKEKLLQKLTNQVPDEFILFKDAIFLDTSDSNISSIYIDKDKSLTYTLKGTLYGILFNEQKLTKKIAINKIENYDGSEVYASNIRDLVFSLSNKENTVFNNIKNINFNLSGPTKIIWKLDVDKFTNDILGKAKSDFNQILSQYINIKSASLTLTPVWKMSIPKEAKDIIIKVNYP